MRLFLLSLLSLSLLFCASPTMAQKKEILAAKDIIKSGKKLEDAQKSMEKLLQDSTNRGNKKIWKVLYDAVLKQYEQGNEKLYLKEKYDTVNLFSLTKKLFEVAESLDSVDALPDKKGRVSLEFRKENAAHLNQIRPNLYNGGAWFVRKQKYEDAYQYFDKYIECSSDPLFGAYDYAQRDKHLASAAYWAVYCGYKMQNPQATLHHAYEALKDTAHYDYMLQYLAETYKLEKDTARYEQTLREGFRHSPKFPFFFPRLVEFYSEQNKLDSAMNVVDKALTVDPENETYLFTKSTVLLNLGKNQECYEICKQLIARNDSLEEAYYNAGLSNFNMGVERSKSAQANKKAHNEVLAYYKEAKPYLEKYRSFLPDALDKWGLPLYTIYLNLNMGKEFDEVDKLLRKKGK